MPPCVPHLRQTHQSQAASPCYSYPIDIVHRGISLPSGVSWGALLMWSSIYCGQGPQICNFVTTPVLVAIVTWHTRNQILVHAWHWLVLFLNIWLDVPDCWVSSGSFLALYAWMSQWVARAWEMSGTIPWSTLWRCNSWSIVTWRDCVSFGVFNMQVPHGSGSCWALLPSQSKHFSIQHFLLHPN